MIQLIVFIIISGAIAYIGDVIGTYVGKRRLSVFGLRPRVTAILVAIVTGISITLFTLLAAVILSDNVKIAMFSVDQLRVKQQTLIQETTRLENERQVLIKERLALRNDVNRLKSIVRIKETESVVFQKDEPLAAVVLEQGLKPPEAMKKLTDLIISLIKKAKRRGLKARDEITFFKQNQSQLGRMAEYIASSSHEMVVAAVAAENINAGEHLGNVRFLVLPNSLIFRKNEEIASLEVDGKLERGEITRSLKGFMDEINHEVVKLGMIANPLTGRFGDLSSNSMISFYDMVNRIKSLDRKIILIAVVPKDTYAIGPLNVSFKFEETGENIYTTSDTPIASEALATAGEIIGAE